MDKETFILTGQHVKLLRQANVSWNDCEFGAPCVDPKRPYGNGNVYEDMANILGVVWQRDVEDDYMPLSFRIRFDELHKELETALQVVMASGSFEPGTYIADAYSSNWKLKGANNEDSQ